MILLVTPLPLAHSLTRSVTQYFSHSVGIFFCLFWLESQQNNFRYIFCPSSFLFIFFSDINKFFYCLIVNLSLFFLIRTMVVCPYFLQLWRASPSAQSLAASALSLGFFNKSKLPINASETTSIIHIPLPIFSLSEIYNCYRVFAITWDFISFQLSDSSYLDFLRVSYRYISATHSPYQWFKK